MSNKPEPPAALSRKKKQPPGWVQLGADAPPPPPPPPPSATALKRAQLTHQSVSQSLAQQVGREGLHYLRSQTTPLLRYLPWASAVVSGTVATAIGWTSALPAFQIILLGSFFFAGTVYGNLQLQKNRQLQEIAAEINLAGEFDRNFAQWTPQLPPALQESLQQIKAGLGRILPRLQKQQSMGLMTAEDAFFVRQTILQYLPDAMAPYLAMPAERRQQAFAGDAGVAGVAGKSAQDLLHEQLQILLSKLNHIEHGLWQEDGHKMLSHKRFLQDKVGD